MSQEIEYEIAVANYDSDPAEVLHTAPTLEKAIEIAKRLTNYIVMVITTDTTDDLPIKWIHHD